MNGVTSQTKSGATRIIDLCSGGSGPLLLLVKDLAAARKFMLQTAQLGWLNHELIVESAGGIRKVATASQELSASSARLEETMRQLSGTLAGQLKELAKRLDTIQGKVNKLK